MRKINHELWLLLFLVLIAAVLNFLAASQRMALVFYFLPVMFSAYYFGRRHATLTACASVFLVVLLTYVNPAMFNRKAELLPFDNRYFDLTVWGGVLVVAGYAMGTLYERNQKTLHEMKAGYDSMMVILQHVLSHEKYSEAHAYRVSMYATTIAEAMGLDAQSTEDVRIAALLRNVQQLGINYDVLYKAANITHEDLAKTGDKKAAKAEAVGNSLQRAIPIFNSHEQLKKAGQTMIDAPLEVQVLAVADAYETLIGGKDGRKLSPQHAEEIITKSSGKKYDSMVVDAFEKAFGEQARGAGA